MGMILAKISCNWSTAPGGKPLSELVPVWKWVWKLWQPQEDHILQDSPISMCPEMVVDMGNSLRRKGQRSQKIDGSISPERRTRGSRRANPGMYSMTRVVFLFSSAQQDFKTAWTSEGGVFAILPVSKWKVLLWFFCPFSAKVFQVYQRHDISLLIGHQTMGNTNLPGRALFVHHPEVLDFELVAVTGEDFGWSPLEKMLCSYKERVHMDGVKYLKT